MQAHCTGYRAFMLLGEASSVEAPGRASYCTFLPCRDPRFLIRSGPCILFVCSGTEVLDTAAYFNMVAVGTEIQDMNTFWEQKACF
jgi:hypothetical protein